MNKGVKYAMRNDASHAMIQRLPALPKPPCSSFLGKSSSSEVVVKKSMIKVKASIDGEDEGERKVVLR